MSLWLILLGIMYFSQVELGIDKNVWIAISEVKMAIIGQDMTVTFLFRL